MSLRRYNIFTSKGDIIVLQVRIDDETKNKASEVLNNIGIDLSTAVRIFLIKCIAVGGLPFEMNINNSSIRALAALDRMGQKSKELGNDKLTLDEINQIIDDVRKEPNWETTKAILETIEMERNPDKYKSYDSVNKFLEDLKHDSLIEQEVTGVEELAGIIASTGGNGKVSPENQKIIHLYAIGDIDYETAVFAIKRNFKKGNQRFYYFKSS